MRTSAKQPRAAICWKWRAVNGCNHERPATTQLALMGHLNRNGIAADFDDANTPTPRATRATSVAEQDVEDSSNYAS